MATINLQNNANLGYNTRAQNHSARAFAVQPSTQNIKDVFSQFDLKNLPSLNNDFKTDKFVRQNASEDSSKKSNKKKMFIAAGAALFAAAAGILFFHKKPLGNFAEHIDFKQAMTMDEAITFAKNNFGIKEFSFDNDLEFANWVNEGLTNVNNKLKGKARMPKKIGFTNEKPGDNALAYVIHNNDMRFYKDELTKESLLVKVTDSANKIFERNSDGKINIPAIAAKDKAMELSPVWEKLNNEPESFSRMELLGLLYDFEDCMKGGTNPLGALYSMLENESALKRLDEKGIKIEINEFLRLDKKDQIKFLGNVCNEAKIAIRGGANRHNSPFDLLYHEMGHIQHLSTGANLYDKSLGILSDKSKQKFLNSIEEQKIAGRISWYAQTDPEEFVAESFSYMMSDKKLSDETMQLYKKYKGPIIAGKRV